eukprot:1280215-Prymnesium_polylepis.2
MWTNLQSTRLTTAINIQLTALMLPFVTAGMAKVLLHEKIHWALPPTLVASILASVLAICGQAGSDAGGAGGEGGVTATDAGGIALQMVSVVCSAAVKIALKGTDGVLTKTELMLSQMVCTATVMLPIAAALDRASLAALASLSAAGVACFLGLAIGIYIVGNTTQIVATRLIGASNHSASNSLRLLSACAGSWLILDEPIESALQWAGLGMIVIALSVYWAIQRRGVATRASTNASASAATDRPAANCECEAPTVGSGGLPTDASAESAGARAPDRARAVGPLAAAAAEKTQLRYAALEEERA